MTQQEYRRSRHDLWEANPFERKYIAEREEAVKNIRAEQALRKRNRAQARRRLALNMAMVLPLPLDVAGYLASFVPVRMPISRSSIDHIEHVFYGHLPFKNANHGQRQASSEGDTLHSDGIRRSSSGLALRTV